MSRWTEFRARHPQNFTPAFNAYLEAQIADADLEIEVRIGAWLFRGAWGNHSDSVVSKEEGIIQGQSDCARDLGVDRRAVNPAFRKLERGNYVRTVGREIFLVDDPRGMFDGFSPIDGPYPDPGRNRLTDFQYFTEHIWGAQNPQRFQRLQEIEREHKQIRTEILSQFKAHRRKLETEENQLSEGADNSLRRAVRKGRTRLRRRADKRAETGGRTPIRSLLLRTENRRS